TVTIVVKTTMTASTTTTQTMINRKRGPWRPLPMDWALADVLIEWGSQCAKRAIYTFVLAEERKATTLAKRRNRRWHEPTAGRAVTRSRGRWKPFHFEVRALCGRENVRNELIYTLGKLSSQKCKKRNKTIECHPNEKLLVPGNLSRLRALQ